MEQLQTYDKYDFVQEFYDHVVSYKGRKDIDFFMEIARGSGGPVLEIGCGTGRVLTPIARAGIEIVGLDLAASMIAVCQKKLAQEPETVQSNVTLVQGDMRNFDLQRTFNLVTLPFRPFEELTTVEDQLDCLKSVNRHLDMGGRLILDLFNADLPHLASDSCLVEGKEEPPFTMPDGRTVVRKQRIRSRDWFNQVNDIEFIYYVTYPDGRKERLVHQ
ncbi:MAG: class I SAM-dependent methyltransferase [Planctomycetes bacterium]|nr:class I SAM-dependent methyltransferase [Planctomycetota bacterium]